MGIFDFVKDAGEGLKDKVLGDDGADDLTKTVEVSSERVEQLRQENIAQKVAKLAIDGEQVNVAVIFEANRPMLSDPDKIYPGQKLRIPPA